MPRVKGPGRKLTSGWFPATKEVLGSARNGQRRKRGRTEDVQANNRDDVASIKSDGAEREDGSNGDGRGESQATHEDCDERKGDQLKGLATRAVGSAHPR